MRLSIAILLIFMSVNVGECGWIFGGGDYHNGPEDIKRINAQLEAYRAAMQEQEEAEIKNRADEKQRVIDATNKYYQKKYAAVEAKMSDEYLEKYINIEANELIIDPESYDKILQKSVDKFISYSKVEKSKTSLLTRENLPLDGSADKVLLQALGEPRK